MGALTPKVFAFSARSWELRKQQSIDVLDCFGKSINIEYRGIDILRIIPCTDKKYHDNWITDCIRFMYDGLRRQRLNLPMIRNRTRYYNISWNDMMSLIIKLFNSNDLLVQSVIGFATGSEVNMITYKLINQFKHNFSCHERIYAINHDFRYYSSVDIINQQATDIDCIIIVNCDSRINAPYILPVIRKSELRKQLLIISIHTINQINDLKIHNIPNINLFLEGKHSVCKKLNHKKKILFIFGNYSSYNYNTINLWLYSINNLFEKSLFLFIHVDGSFRNFSDIGVQACDKLSSYNNKILFLINSNNVNWFDSTFYKSLYIGAIADNSINKVNFILPCSNYTEKTDTFINTFNKVQHTSLIQYLSLNISSDLEILLTLYALKVNTKTNIFPQLFYDFTPIDCNYIYYNYKNYLNYKIYINNFYSLNSINNIYFV